MIPLDPGRVAPTPTSADALDEHFVAGFRELFRAFRYADEIGEDVWTFAVEIGSLRALGLSDNDLRWLVCRGLLEHAGEVTPLGHDVRTYRQTGRLRFCRRTCFVLTVAGARAVGQHLRQAPGFDAPADPPAPEEGPAAAPRVAEGALPRWDAVRQELRFGRVLVKRFKVPAPNQEVVLAAFEEEGWPGRIDDPIPPQMEIDPKRRLHDTINSLNRCQKTTLIRFLGDGRGLGVRWEPVAAEAETFPVRGRANGWTHAAVHGNGSAHANGNGNGKGTVGH